MFSTSDLFALAEGYADDSGWLGPALPMIFGLAIGSRASDMLEIGVHHGASTRALLLAARMNGGHLTSIDIEDCFAAVPRELAIGRWAFIKGDSGYVLPRIGKAFDFAYIDGSHTFEAVSRELRILDSLMRPGATVLLDDCWPEWQGVLDAFNQFESARPMNKALLPYGTERSLSGKARTFGLIRY